MKKKALGLLMDTLYVLSQFIFLWQIIWTSLGPVSSVFLFPFSGKKFSLFEHSHKNEDGVKIFKFVWEIFLSNGWLCVSEKSDTHMKMMSKFSNLFQNFFIKWLTISFATASKYQKEIFWLRHNCFRLKDSEIILMFWQEK